MLDVKFIASVAERDIDLVMMEELSVSDEFRDWLSSRIYGYPVFQSEIGSWHSVVDGAFGESDIVFIFTSQSGQRIALLIENKIDAPPQDQQGERYRLRGQNGVGYGFWDEFKTAVIAPEKYLCSSKHSETYDTEISYEEILSFFSSRRFRDNRYLYKAKLLLEAIEQNRRGYQPEYSEEMTVFVKKYCEFAQENFMSLGVQQAKPRPSGSTWTMFNPRGYPKHISGCHQLTAGVVKFFFKDPRGGIEEMQNRYQPYANEGVELAQTGKSIAISLAVPKVNPIKNTFEMESQSVIEALESIARLDKIIRKVEFE